jgi:hypothetical protein
MKEDVPVAARDTLGPDELQQRRATVLLVDGSSAVRARLA